MSLWTIEPRDPFVVRDGRPNHGRSESATLPFPMPSTIAGMIRTRLGSDARGVFDPDQDISSLLCASMRGPLLARLGDGALFVPPPRDALVQGGTLRRLAPMKDLPAGAIFDARHEGAPIGLLPGPEAPAKKAKAEVAWWPWAMFERWLAEPGAMDGQAAKGLLEGAMPALPTETRAHVKLGASWTAEDGMLFEARGLRFTTKARERLALAVDVDSDRAMRAGVGPGGGERRLVHWQAAQGITWPALPSGVREAVARAGSKARVRVVLLTPATFAAGHRPGGEEGQLLAPRAGVTPALVGMCVPRPETISGWDFAKRQPKATRRLVPAGSLYWLDLEGSPEARVAWAEGVMMTNVSDAEQDRRDGFGLAAVGVGS